MLKALGVGSSSDRFARSMQIQTEWERALQDTPNLLLLNGNYFDLLPNEMRTVHATPHLSSFQGSVAVYF
jgi:hypothetical protein